VTALASRDRAAASRGVRPVTPVANPGLARCSQCRRGGRSGTPRPRPAPTRDTSHYLWLPTGRSRPVAPLPPSPHGYPSTGRGRPPPRLRSREPGSSRSAPACNETSVPLARGSGTHGQFYQASQRPGVDATGARGEEIGAEWQPQPTVTTGVSSTRTPRRRQ